MNIDFYNMLLFIHLGLKNDKVKESIVLLDDMMLQLKDKDIDDTLESANIITDLKNLPIDTDEAQKQIAGLNERAKNLIASYKPASLADPATKNKFLADVNKMKSESKVIKDAYEARLALASDARKKAMEIKDGSLKAFSLYNIDPVFRNDPETKEKFKNKAANFDPKTGAYNQFEDLSNIDYMTSQDMSNELIKREKAINENARKVVGNDVSKLGEYHNQVLNNSREEITASEAYKGIFDLSDDPTFLRSALIQKNPNITIDELNEAIANESIENKNTKEPGKAFNTDTITGKLLQASLDRATYKKTAQDRDVLNIPNAAVGAGIAEDKLKSLTGGSGYDESQILEDAPGLACC